MADANDSDEVHLAVADWSVAADGDIYLSSSSGGVYVSATGDDGSVMIDADTTASIYCGPVQFIITSSEEGVAGNITANTGVDGSIALHAGPIEEGGYLGLTAEQVRLMLGLPDLGALLQMTPESLKLTVGAPGVGASIELTPEAITLRVAETVLTLTPEGITEAVAEVTREVTPEGHNFTAAETELNVGVEGMMYEGPTAEAEVEAAAEVSHSLANITTEGVKAEEAALLTVE